jgi:hypothetical protein
MKESISLIKHIFKHIFTKIIMAYDEYLGDRIRQTLNEKQVHFTELKMMGGLCFKVEEKMICGIHIDKNTAIAY